MRDQRRQSWMRSWLRRNCAAFASNRVDAAAREAALTHVVRGHDQLQLLDRVQADRLRFGLAAGRMLY